MSEFLKKMRAINKPIKVQAIRDGYYMHQLRRAGDVFWIENGRAFSEVWMIDPKQQSMPEVIEPEFVTANQKGAPSSLTPGVQGRTRISSMPSKVENSVPDFDDLKEPAKGAADQAPENSQPEQPSEQPAEQQGSTQAGTGNQEVI